MVESKYNKFLTFLLIVIGIAILGILGFLVVDYIGNYMNSKKAADFVEEFSSSFSTSSDESEAVESENVTVTESNEVAINNANSGVSKKSYQGYSTVGTIKIPKINVSYPILEEVSAKALNLGVVVLYPYAEHINMEGNTVIIGHNYRNGMFFSNLKNLGVGDKITITDYRGKTINYKVYDKFEASSTDTSFYQRDTNGEPEITLSSCTDASNDQRLIIFAK